ncbi:MAG TPA: hypothetical protein VK158_00400 [Acidobacteriota bacterium]|nr:hypothetical protein [Acidobacteriota bacterium]
MQKRAQNWSVEIIVSLSVFIVMFIAVFAIVQVREPTPLSKVQSESEIFLERFYSSEPSSPRAYEFIYRNVVDTDKLVELSELDYESLKAQLGIKSDFCIILLDENGNVIPINGKYGVGSENIYVDGAMNCTSDVS